MWLLTNPSIRVDKYGLRHFSSSRQSYKLAGTEGLQACMQASGTAHEGTGILSENSGIFIDGTSKFLKAEGGAPLGGLASSRDHSASSYIKSQNSIRNQ